MQLEAGLKELGYVYHRKRSSSNVRTGDITSGMVAEAVLSVILRRPHQAKFKAKEHFGKLYQDIFSESLNAAQTVIAVLIYRFTERRRKQLLDADKQFVRYASCFLAMQMAVRLSTDKDLGENFARLNHRNFAEVESSLTQNMERYFNMAVEDIDEALGRLYGATYLQNISLQQLSATFRRADLISMLCD